MRSEHIVAAVLIVFFLLSGLYYAGTNSATSDEPTYITAGYINLRFNDYTFNTEHPPLAKQLAAMPLLFLKPVFPMEIYKTSTRPIDILRIYDSFLFGIGNNLDLMLFFARIPNILISSLLGVFIYLCAVELLGAAGGIVSLALFVFSPSFLGHSPLATMDTTVSSFYFMTIYFFMKFTRTGSNLFLALTGILIGLSLSAKCSAMSLVPILCVSALIYSFKFFEDRALGRLKIFMFILPLIPFAMSYKSSFRLIVPFLLVFLFSGFVYRNSFYSKRFKYFSAVMLIMIVIALTVVIIDYTDYKWFPFHSATKAYFRAFSCSVDRATGGDNAYLLGASSKNGWWYYYPLAMIFKEPFSFLAVVLIGLVSFFMRKEGLLSKCLIILPPAAYLFSAMFLNKVNIGMRLILPIYPFICIIGGYSVLLAKRYRIMAYIIALFMLILPIDVLSAYPSHLSYFNRLIGGPDKGYLFLNDSNVAWGQDWKRAKEYIDKNGIKEVRLKAGFTCRNNCKYYKIRYVPMSEKEMICPDPGFYIIETHTLSLGRVKWAEKIRPYSRIGGSLLVYRITQKDADECVKRSL